jgi:hypothetical protein
LPAREVGGEREVGASDDGEQFAHSQGAVFQSETAWDDIYRRLDPAGRLSLYRLMRRRLRFARVRRSLRRGLFAFGRLFNPPSFLRWPPRRAFCHGVCTFGILALLPAEPLSIPTALGLGFALLVYLHSLRPKS